MNKSIHNIGNTNEGYYNKSGTHNILFQDVNGNHTGHHEIQQHNHSSVPIILEDHEIGGAHSQRMDQLGGGTQNNSNTGSLTGSQSSIGSQSYQTHNLNFNSLSNSNLNLIMSSTLGQNQSQNSNSNSHLPFNSLNTSNPHQYNHQILNGSVSHKSSPQFHNHGNPRQQTSQSLYQRQSHHSVQPKPSSQTHSMPPSPSPSPPSSPALQACQINGYPSRSAYSQSSQLLHSSSSSSPKYSQSSQPSQSYQITQPSQYSQSSQTFQITLPSQPTQLSQLTHPIQITHPTQPSQLTQPLQPSQQSYLSHSNYINNYNIPIEKVVWDYLHFLYRQNTGTLGHLTPYIDESFNIGKFHCMVTEFCKRQRISKDALIIHSKNWFKDYLDHREAQNVEFTLEEEIKRYITSKIKHYENLGFQLESKKILKFYCKLVPFMIKNLWRRLENASFQRVDWESRQFLGSEIDPKLCNYDMVNKVMRLNNSNFDGPNKDHTDAFGAKAARLQDHDQETPPKESHEMEDYLMDANSDSAKRKNQEAVIYKGNINDNSGHINGPEYGERQSQDDLQNKDRKDPDEYDEQTKEMVIVSRTQKWLLRNVKLEDFKYLIRMDQLKVENTMRNNASYKCISKSKSKSSNSTISVRLPKKTQNVILDYINLCHYKM